VSLILYSGPLSLFSRKVEIALGEKGLPFERIMVPFTQAEGYSPKHPEVLKANPKGQVPVLLDGDTTLFDSTLIFEYLEDAYPKLSLLPTSAVARAQCRLIELMADEVVLPKVARLMYRTEPANPDQTLQDLAEKDGALAEAELTKTWQDLDNRLTGQNWFGEDFSIADIGMFMTLVFARRLGAPSWAQHVNLNAWFERTGNRPAPALAAREIAAADRDLSPET
jgi:glutathione S-transferase